MLHSLSRRRLPFVLVAAFCLLGGSARAAEPVELESPHLRIRYEPPAVSREQAEAARAAAERSWERCASVFGTQPAHRILLDLSPDFVGATAFARPGDLKSTDPRKASVIGLRLADLDYLGVGLDYVLTHEMAHVFSGRLADAPLGEGIADWAAGSFYGIPLAPWWGTALSRAGLWVSPDALFITGDYVSPAEVDARTRTAEYAEAALLVRFLVRGYGWERFVAFAPKYAEARRTLRSNETAAAPGGWSPFERAPSRRPPRRSAAPDPERVRRAFSDAFDQPWSAIRDRWEAEMAADPVPAAAARLVLGEEIYGAIRNYEMWVLRHPSQAPQAARDRIRAAFTEANHAMAASDLPAAERQLLAARQLVRSLKEPPEVAGQPSDFGRLLGMRRTADAWLPL